MTKENRILMDDSALARFNDKYKINPVTGCWEWSAATDRDGYGQFKLDGKQKKSHRVSYEHHVGKIPEGHHIDHFRRNPGPRRMPCSRGCCNPEHLEPVTGGENSRRAELGKNNSTKTHCPQGHEYNWDNVYITPLGQRRCRICNNESSRLSKERKRRGFCPLCKEENPYNTTRERRPNGYTRCGSCGGRTRTIDWKQPDAT